MPVVNSLFHVTACNAMHGIIVAVLSVCQMCVLWQNKIIICQYLNTIPLVFPVQRGLLGIVPFYPKYSPKVTYPLQKTTTLRYRLMFCAGPVWPIHIQVVLPAWPIGPCVSCLVNIDSISGDWPDLYRTTGGADNCTMKSSGLGTAHSSCTVSLR